MLRDTLVSEKCSAYTYFMSFMYKLYKNIMESKGLNYTLNNIRAGGITGLCTAVWRWSPPLMSAVAI